MGTRSTIIAKLSDGSWKAVYCHWDGYLDNNGRILFKHYNTQKKVDALLKHGDMSSLQEKCTKPKGHTFNNPVKGYTIYYGRDRGEKDVAGTIGDSLSAVFPDSDTWTEYVYVWDGDEWSVGDPLQGTQTLVKLSYALKVLEEQKIDVVKERNRISH